MDKPFRSIDAQIKYLAERGTVSDAEARVQAIIERSAAGKKSRGYEVGA